MAEKDKDELADALKRLARGDARDDSENIAPSDSAPLDIPSPSSKKPPPVVPPRVAKSAALKPAVPTSGRARPVTPRPSMPAGAPKQESARAESPLAPPPPSEKSGETNGASDEVSSSLANVVDDSDLSVAFVAGAAGPRVPLPAKASDTLKLRRTFIPIVLTLGVCLPLLAAWWFDLDNDSPLKEPGLKLPITLLAVGIVMLGLAVLNMVSVRNELAQRPS